VFKKNSLFTATLVEHQKVHRKWVKPLHADKNFKVFFLKRCLKQFFVRFQAAQMLILLIKENGRCPS